MWKIHGYGWKSKNKSGWWTTEVASAIREKKEAWKVIEKMKVNGNQPDGGMLHLYGQEKSSKESCRVWTTPGMTRKHICTLN